MPAEERTEQATQRRRQEARRRGNVAKSVELTSAAEFLAMALLFPVLGALLFAALAEAMRVGLRWASDLQFTQADVLRHAQATLTPALIGWLPLLGLVTAVGIGVNLLQVGFLFTLQPLAPDANRINPGQGLQRLFSRRSVVEMLKAIAKTLIIGWVAWFTLSANSATIAETGLMPPLQAFAVVGGVLSQIVLRIAFLWLALAGFDYAFQRWQNEVSMRMTKEEVRRETKEQEVSPFIRGKIRQRQRQLARGRMMQDVKRADVVVTNPVTFAVAIRYDLASMRAPRVLAKGRHKTAQRIRKEAVKHNIPIVANPPLARELHDNTEVGDEVPTTLYQAVAELLAYVYTLRGRRLG